MFLHNEASLSGRSNDLLEQSLLTAWLEASDTGLCVLDSSGLVVTLNAAACKQLRIDGISALNQPVAIALGHLDLSADLLQRMTDVGSQGESHVVRKALDGDQQHLLLKYRAVSASTGEHFKMLSFTDITNVVTVQQQEAQRRQWQAVNAGVVISDARLPDMPIVYVNPHFEQMSGYAADEIVGRNCRFLQGADLDQPALQAIRHAIKQQTNGYAVLRNYRKDGTQFLNELFISPIKDGHGQVTHFMGIQHLRADSTTP